MKCIVLLEYLVHINLTVFIPSVSYDHFLLLRENPAETGGPKPQQSSYASVILTEGQENLTFIFTCGTF